MMKRSPMPPRTIPLDRAPQLSVVEGGTAAPVLRMPTRTRIRPVSDKRRAENRQRRAMAEARFPGMNPPCTVPWCHLPADDLHEILTRARGGSITDPENTVPVCRHHNEALTLEPEWGYRLKLLKHSGRCCQGDGGCTRYPPDGPVLIDGGVRVWLGDGGAILYGPPEGAA